MKDLSYKKLFWGVLLVMIGILFILKNTGVITFSLFSFWYLWPLVLVLWGVSLIPVKDWIKLATSVGVIALSVIVVQNTDIKKSNWGMMNWDIDEDKDNEEDDSTSSSSTYSYSPLNQAYDAKTKSAMLNMELAAADFKLIETSADNLIEIMQNKATSRYSMTSNTVDSLTTIDVTMKNKGNIKTKENATTFIKLNPNPLWDINMKVGAADADFDFTPYKTKSISIDGGAADIDMKIGNLYPDIKMTINSGAADIDIKIPKTSGCEIISNIVLGSRDFEGFEKVNSQSYQTANYKTSPNKIRINLKAGISSVSVERY